MVSHMRVPPGGNSQNIPPMGIYPLGVWVDTSGMCMERFANVYETESGMCLEQVGDVYETHSGCVFRTNVRCGMRATAFAAALALPTASRLRFDNNLPRFLGMPIGPVSRPLASFSAHLHMTGMSCACRLLGRMPTRFRYAYALPDT